MKWLRMLSWKLLLRGQIERLETCADFCRHFDLPSEQEDCINYVLAATEKRLYALNRKVPTERATNV